MNNNNKKMTVIKKKEKALKAAGMKTAAGNGTKGGKAKSQQRSAARSGEGCGADRAEGEGEGGGQPGAPLPKAPPHASSSSAAGGETPRGGGAPHPPPAPAHPNPPSPPHRTEPPEPPPSAPHSPTPLPPPLSERRTNFRAARSGAGGARGGAVPAELRGVRSPPSPHLPAAMGRGGSCVAPRSALTHLSAPSAGPRRACGRTASTSTSTSSPPPLLLFLPTEKNFDGAAAPGLLTALGAERHGGPRGTGTAAAPGAPRRLLGWAGRRRAGAVRSAGSPGPGRGRTRRAQLRGSARRGGGGGGGAGAAARGGRRPPYHSSSKAGAAAFPARPPTPPRKRREEGGSAPARRFVRGKRRPHPRAPAVAGRGAAPPPTSPFFC